MLNPTTCAPLRQGGNFTPRQYADKWRVDPETVLRWIKRGELVAVDVSAGNRKKPRWRISQEAAAAFEARRSSRTPSPKPTRTRRTLQTVKQYV